MVARFIVFIIAPNGDFGDKNENEGTGAFGEIGLAT
jgi:hypothetical protein